METTDHTMVTCHNPDHRGIHPGTFNCWQPSSWRLDNKMSPLPERPKPAKLDEATTAVIVLAGVIVGAVIGVGFAVRGALSALRRLV